LARRYPCPDGPLRFRTKKFTRWERTEIIKSLIYFILAGLCEIGGGYLVWLWLREGKPIGYALGGAAVLFLYGIIPTFQPAHFGRVYAAYGGVFIVLSILWGWKVDKISPDTFDIIGGMIALVGVGIIMYWPRG
jgi:small multidrug resistance family-3 protein